MSDHPENQGKMHELLEAYAKKRRAEAGEPTPMHPATRNLLQAEVRKQHPSGPSQSSKGSWRGRLTGLLSLYLPRLAIACGLIALLALGVRYVFRDDSSRTMLASVERAEPMPAPVSPAAEPTTRPAAPAPSPLVEHEAFSETRSETTTLTRKPAEVALYDEAKGRRSAVPAAPKVAAPPRPLAPTAERSDPTLTFSLAQSGAAGASRDQSVAPQLPPAPAPEARQLKQGYAEVAPRSRAALASADTATPSLAAKRFRAVVLANFELQQTGNQLRVVDVDDGSVYDGQLVNANEAVRLNEELAKRETAQKSKLPGAFQKDAGKAIADSNTAPRQSVAGWNFRVSGTNRTLQEPVVLDGVLLTTSGVATGKLSERFGVTVTNSNSTRKVAGPVSGPRFYRAQTAGATPPPASAPAPEIAAAPVQDFGVSSVTKEDVGAKVASTDSFSVQRVQGTLRIAGTNIQAIDAYRANVQPAPARTRR